MKKKKTLQNKNEILQMTKIKMPQSIMKKLWLEVKMKRNFVHYY